MGKEAGSCFSSGYSNGVGLSYPHSDDGMYYLRRGWAVSDEIVCRNLSFMDMCTHKIRVQVAEPLNDSFLNFGIGSEMATCQVLLQRSEEMKITWCEIRNLGTVFKCLCGGRAR
ncbi:hypothetical protein AVEN_80888-1 [Araneus ventricosus]|uniref:Uncharacterized protein n=1 Tax=Araneus ventricosus TaxID=182803 RepID=A0A4Y2DN35_ARAVE|nr:hypothetical protein AVEN_80888-1 [Araneus ventricosus]